MIHSNQFYIRKKNTFVQFVIGIAAIICSLSNAVSQPDNTPFYSKDTIYGKKNDLFFNLKSLSFNQNDEYYTKFANGQTFFGFQIEPGLELNLSDNISLTAGVFANKDFGNPEFSSIQPIYKLKVAGKSGLFIFGNINSHLNHRYIEPIYDFRSLLIRPRENGIQYLLNKGRLKSDLWIDWQRNIYEGSNFLEQIFGGMHTSYCISDTGNFQLSIPLQYLVYHEGGQIDAVDDPLQLKSNGALGFKISLPQKGWLDKIETENHFVFYNDHMIDDEKTYHKGFGWYYNLGFYKKHHSLMFTYWRGNQYIGIRGAPALNSESNSYKWAGFTDPIRRLFFVRFVSNYKLSEGVYLSLRLEPYFDLDFTLQETFNNGIMDISNSLFINLEKRFFVTNLKGHKSGIRK